LAKADLPGEVCGAVAAVCDDCGGTVGDIFTGWSSGYGRFTGGNFTVNGVFLTCGDKPT